VKAFLRCLSISFLGGGMLLAEDFEGSAHKLEFDTPPIGYSSAEATDPVA
jgi:hypothetical protein